MKCALKIACLLLFVMAKGQTADRANNFAPTAQYLVDSLNLAALGKPDRHLLDSCLKVYHAAKHDTDRINALNGICEGMMDKCWHRYQHFQLGLIERSLSSFSSSSPSRTEVNTPLVLKLKTSLAAALNNIGIIYFDQGAMLPALEYYRKSLKIREEIDDKRGLADSYNNIGLIHNIRGEVPLALSYYFKCLKIYTETGNRAGMATTCNNIGVIYNDQGNVQMALEYHEKSLKIKEATGDKKGMAESFNGLAVVYKNLGDIPLSLEYHHKSLKIREEIGDKNGMAQSYNNLGYIHNNQGDLATALDFYGKSLKLREEVGDRRGMGVSYMNIGLIHDKQGNLILALEHYRKSLQIREAIGDKKGMSNAYRNFGVFLCKSDSGDKGMEYLRKGLKIAEELGEKESISESLVIIGSYLFRKGDLAAARAHGERGLAIAQEIGYPRLAERNALLLYKVAQKQGRYKEAYEMRNLQIQMHDSIAGRESIEAAVKQQARYEYEKRQAIKDLEHENQLALAAEQEEKQKIILAATGAALILVIGFLVVVYNRFKVTRAQKGIIETQKQLVDGKNREILDSIRYARRIQEAILPSVAAMQNALQNSFVLYKPKDVVAGDFYWLEKQDDKIYFAAADCTGHGVPGAMVSVVCSHALSKALLEEKARTTGELLDKTREIVLQRLAKSSEGNNEPYEALLKDGMDISLCAIDFNNMNLQWSGANNPLWIIRNGELLEIKHDKQPVGRYDKAYPFTTHNITMEENDTLYIFTDGFQDQFGGEHGKKFRSSRLKETLLAVQKEEMEVQRIILDKEFERWRGSLEQVDDVCMIGVRIKVSRPTPQASC